MNKLKQCVFSLTMFPASIYVEIAKCAVSIITHNHQRRCTLAVAPTTLPTPGVTRERVTRCPESNNVSRYREAGELTLFSREYNNGPLPNCRWLVFV